MQSTMGSEQWLTGLKQWLSNNVDLKRCITVIVGISIIIPTLGFISWRLTLIAEFLAGYLLMLFWNSAGDEEGPECNTYSILMTITSCVLVTALSTIFHWGGCAVLSEFELFPEECRNSIQRFMTIVASALFVGALLAIPTLLDWFKKARKMRSAIGSPCGISRRIIQKDDNFFWIPMFPCNSRDPLAKYRETCVLRDEFEKWELKEPLVQKVKEFWEQWYSTSGSFSIVFHDDVYLIVKNKMRQDAIICFLRSLFFVSVPREEWKEFCDQMMGPISEISTDFCTVKEKGQRVEIEIVMKYRRDCIEVTLQEWEHFQSALKTAHEAMSGR